MIVLLLLLLSGVTDWTSTRSRADAILEGSFTSCPSEDDGGYGEKVYVHRSRGRAAFEIHLGPRQSFAVFAGEVDGERDHGGPDNLLGPASQYDDVPTLAGGRNWAISSLNLHVNIVRGPGSFEECYQFFVLIEPLSVRKVAER